jgi:hypothetical protein
MVRRHLCWIAARRPVSVTEPFSCTDEGWLWPCVAWKLWLLAPSMLPDFVGPSSVRMSENSIGCAAVGVAIIRYGGEPVFGVIELACDHFLDR